MLLLLIHARCSHDGKAIIIQEGAKKSDTQHRLRRFFSFLSLPTTSRVLLIKITEGDQSHFKQLKIEKQPAACVVRFHIYPISLTNLPRVLVTRTLHSHGYHLFAFRDEKRDTRETSYSLLKQNGGGLLLGRRRALFKSSSQRRPLAPRAVRDTMRLRDVQHLVPTFLE